MTAAVFFDLDGTLADTAPDLAGALNTLLARHGRPPVPYDEVRSLAAYGAQRLLRAGFGLSADDPGYAALRDEYLNLYGEAVCRHSALFPGMAEVLDALRTRNIPWGVVTNKHSRFTIPLLQKLGLTEHLACTISGDSCGNAKPHPEPLLLAATQLGVRAEDCLYVGDTINDLKAAEAAGMRVLIAGWGYFDENESRANWNPTAWIEKPAEILDFI